MAATIGSVVLTETVADNHVHFSHMLFSNPNTFINKTGNCCNSFLPFSHVSVKTRKANVITFFKSYHAVIEGQTVSNLFYSNV